jgi:hypothetical protein
MKNVFPEELKPMIEIASIPQVFIILPNLIMGCLFPSLIKFNDFVETFAWNLNFQKNITI